MDITIVIILCVGVSIFSMALGYAFRNLSKKVFFGIVLATAFVGCSVYYGADVIGGYLTADVIRFDYFPFEIDLCVVNALVFGFLSVCIGIWILGRIIIPFAIVYFIGSLLVAMVIYWCSGNPMLSAFVVFGLCCVSSVLLRGVVRESKKENEA